MKPKFYLNRNVALTGLTSFFTDVSTEMVYPLLQAFVSAVLASKSALVGPVLGIIEGVAESTAMTDGVEKAFVSRLAPHESKATALGFSHTIVGIGLLPASVIAGALFTLRPAAPFIFGACTSIATIVILAVFVKENR